MRKPCAEWWSRRRTGRPLCRSGAQTEAISATSVTAVCQTRNDVATNTSVSHTLSTYPRYRREAGSNHDVWIGIFMCKCFTNCTSSRWGNPAERFCDAPRSALYTRPPSVRRTSAPPRSTPRLPRRLSWRSIVFAANLQVGATHEKGLPAVRVLTSDLLSRQDPSNLGVRQFARFVRDGHATGAERACRCD